LALKLEHLTSHEMESIAAAAARKLVPLADDLGGITNLNVGATLEVWVLQADALLGEAERLHDVATPTGRWIGLLEEVQAGEAESRTVGDLQLRPLGGSPPRWAVTAAGIRSGETEALSKALRWAASNAPADVDYVARVFTAPMFQLRAVWLEPVQSTEDSSALLLPYQTPKTLMSKMSIASFVKEADMLDILRRSPPVLSLVE
jgi:hypothetical protein